jgi:lysophospholipase L1-like esterase
MMAEIEHIKSATTKWRLIYVIPLIAIYAFVFSLAYLYVAGFFYGRGHYPWKPYTAARMSPKSEYLPGTSAPTLFSVNYRGLRGGDPAQTDFLILVLGGSTTEGFYLDDSDTYPQIMVDIVNAKGTLGKVVASNAAKAGLRLRHNYLQAKELLPELKRTKLVLILTGPNDVVSFLRDPYSDDKPTAESDSAAFSYVATKNLPWSRNLIQFEYNYIRNLVNSQKLRLLLKTRIKKPRGDDFPQDKDGTTYVERRRRRMEAEKIDLPQELIPMLDSRLASYKSCLEDMTNEIIRNGATPILITHPINYSPDMSEEQKRLWWVGQLGSRVTGNNRTVFLTEKAMTDLLEKFNQVSRDIAAVNKDKVILIDLADTLRGESGLYYDSWHFNIPGARRVGEILADVISSRFSPSDKKPSPFQ